MPKDVKIPGADLAPLVHALQSRQELRARELLLDPALAAQTRRMSRLDPEFGSLVSQSQAFHLDPAIRRIQSQSFTAAMSGYGTTRTFSTLGN